MNHRQLSHKAIGHHAKVRVRIHFLLLSYSIGSNLRWKLKDLELALNISETWMILSFLWVRESLHFISRKLKTDHFELLNYKGGEKWKKLLQSKKEPTNFFLFLLVTLLSETKLSGCSTAVEHMPHDRVFVGSYQTGYQAFFSCYGSSNVSLTKKVDDLLHCQRQKSSNLGLQFFCKRLVEAGF